MSSAWVVAVGLLLLGCGESSASVTGFTAEIWIGSVTGTDVLLAIVQTEERRSLFFCGGAATYREKTRWFNVAEHLDAPFFIEEGGWTIRGELQGDFAEGSLTAGEEPSEAWTAQPAAPDTLAGLYEGVGPCGKLGVIVTQGRAAARASGQGACLRVDGETRIVEQVNPVMPIALTESGGVRVTVGSEEDELTVHPVISR